MHPSSEIVKGINTDLVKGSTSYHIQTEDWGPKVPYIVTQVFLNGAVIETVKVDYLTLQISIIKREPEKIRLAIELQHHRVQQALYDQKTPHKV